MSKHLSTTSRTFPPTTSPPTTSPYTHPIAIGVYHFANIIPGQTDADYAQQADFFFNTVTAHNFTTVTKKYTDAPPRPSTTTTTLITPTSTITTTITIKGTLITTTVTAAHVKPDFWVLDWEDARGHSLSVTERAKFAKTFVKQLYNTNLVHLMFRKYSYTLVIIIGEIQMLATCMNGLSHTVQSSGLQLMSPTMCCRPLNLIGMLFTMTLP